MPHTLWSRDEMILALNLYLKLPFGKMHKGNPEIIKLSQLIGRTPDAVAYRLVNYASYDPELKKRGVSGMTHGGKKCKDYWDEFIEDREKLIFESEQILSRYEQTSLEKKFSAELADLPQNLVGEARVQQVKIRVNQIVFRQIVLANYDGKCALTGIDIPELLVSSHIIPWAKNEKERLNPRNGLCLSALYDRAFDQGLISFDSAGKTIFSAYLLSNINKDYFHKYFKPIYGKTIAKARKYPVDPTFLKWHRDHIFDK